MSKQTIVWAVSGGVVLVIAAAVATAVLLRKFIAPALKETTVTTKFDLSGITDAYKQLRGGRSRI